MTPTTIPPTPPTLRPPARLVPAWVGPSLMAAATAVVAVLGGVIAAKSVESGWYAALVKPSWTPPDWVFGPVWTTLYVCMAVAAGLVWRAGRQRDVRPAIRLFLAQLALNLLWSVLFFGLKRPTAAAVEIELLFALVALTTIAFWRVSRWAGWLFAPYLVWVGYASTLGVGIAVLNG